jgi:hypothetical protein
LTELPQKIAAALGETKGIPLSQIERIVEILGEERAQGLLDETLKVEAEGGLLTADKKRRRTPGGVFFKLTKDQTTPEQRRAIFPHLSGQKKKKKKKKSIEPPPLDQIIPLVNETLQTRGKVSKVKITLIGRPGKIVEKEQVVITSLQSTTSPTLPKGLPVPPAEPTPYVVFISMKQWRKVRDAIQSNPEDKLIIEGYPVFDKRLAGGQGAMTVYAQNTTTIVLQRAQREAQKAT